MAYEFEVEESVSDALRRCEQEQLGRAVGELTDGVKVDPIEAVHEARKALKMERSLLRLGRGALPRSARRRRNGAVRDAARQLSGARDADVLIEALDGLSERYAGQVPATTFDALREHLVAERDRSREALETSGAITAVAERLRGLAAEPVATRSRRGGWTALEPGLRRGYVRGRAAMRRAQSDPTDENLHEWRKRVKDHWYHLRLLAPTAPLTLEGHVKAAHELSDRLGDDHDLAVLHGRLVEIAAALSVDAGPVLALLEHRRAELQAEARALGARAYAERPKAFTRRLRRYRQAARAQLRAAARARPGELSERARQAPVV